jgi:hypothetical protein
MRIALIASLTLLWLVSCVTPPSAPPAAPVAEPVTAPVVEPPPVVTPPPPADTGEFQVSVERKQSSLAEIRVLVDKLNALIQKKAFQEWKTYLDQDYIRTYSDPVKLRDVTARDPVLKNLNIKLKNLEDFFKFEVVPSRADTVVDDISFVDENRVYVWTVVDNERFLLYLLKLYGKEWKISSW